MSSGPSLIQEERDFQSELDTLTVDDHRVRVQQDIEDFVTGSPRRSVSRNREGSQSPNSYGDKGKKDSKNTPKNDDKKDKGNEKDKDKDKEEKKVKSPESSPARTASPIASLFGSLADFGRKNEEKYKEKVAEIRALKTGMRVERNEEHWQWGNQDGGKGNYGTCLSVDETLGWATIRWDPVDGKKGKKDNYRWGQEKGGERWFDIKIAPNAPPAPE
eukprot:TRINITY_DN8198_c0_g1_i1.p1 TRINITY_DN8198_c0_g1~~TRINITY_DN8198_c0_g1_i1.p1  ORF type:complete len:217 (+),score=47.00 TRINITY_DN8198_c0_g1_i1:35-685(+)